MVDGPLWESGDLASICFGDGEPSPAQKRLILTAIDRAGTASGASAIPLPPGLLDAAFAATSRRRRRRFEPRELMAAAGFRRPSALKGWASLAAGIAVLCAVSLLVIRPVIQRDETMPHGTPVAVTPELWRALQTYSADPATGDKPLHTLLGPVAVSGKAIVLSDDLVVILKKGKQTGSVIADDRKGALELRPPDRRP